ncbi:MAG: translation initiation factor IF-2, partial [Lachnospiraceae bacterium]|nr:translation initiation factor IF-2 [Lachnospiraceae bacterium]
KQLERPSEKKNEVKEEEKIKVITLPENLTIKELAEKMKIQPAVIIKKLFMQGKVVTVNQEITYEQAEEIAVEFDILCEKEVVVDVIEELLKEEEEDESLMTKRPPVICVMGHVDHGKTSLLDAIRKTHVIDKEAGGITQAIGAYVVNTKGQKITFLDTPGHEAFTAMRMRGANSTDIAILVVAADDGVMPQTVEAINHAKAAGIEIVVAVNKIDKPGANIERVKQELSEYDLVPEDWGGSTVFAPVSAKTGEGIDNLLDMILLTSEILELKANAKRRARGIVIEAELDKGRGPVATVLVQKGTLHVGDFIAAGACHGKVRAMINDVGKRVKEAGPSTPVEILGLNDVPGAGEIFVSPENDKEARNFAQTFISQNKVKLIDETKKNMNLDDLFSQIQAGNLKELNLIIKADVQGSVEAVKESLMKLSNEEVVVKCIHSGVGAINESDVILASASNAIIIGFNVRPDATAKATAESEGVDVRLYDVIYKAIEDVEAAMKGMLDPIFEEKVIGHAEIRQIFKASGIGNIAGSYVLDGQFQRGCSVRISHEGEQIYEGKLASLKRFKDDVKEVKAGFECGLVFEDFQNFTELDIVEAYIMVEVPRT